MKRIENEAFEKWVEIKFVENKVAGSGVEDYYYHASMFESPGETWMIGKMVEYLAKKTESVSIEYAGFYYVNNSEDGQASLYEALRLAVEAEK